MPSTTSKFVVNNDWRSSFILFRGRDGIGMILFKLEPGSAAPGIVDNINWLNKGLCQRNGKLVAEEKKPKERSRK